MSVITYVWLPDMQVDTAFERVVAAARARQAELKASIAAEAKRLKEECKQAMAAAQKPKAEAVAACEEAKRVALLPDAELLQRVGAAVKRMKVSTRSCAFCLFCLVNVPSSLTLASSACVVIFLRSLSYSSSRFPLP